MSGVTIEEVPEDTPVTEPKKPKDTNFEKHIKSLKQMYTQIENLRTASDFMYMMISNRNPKAKGEFITTLQTTLMKTFPTSNINEGLSALDCEILNRVIMSEDPDLQDAIWFHALNEMKSLSDWFLYGDPSKGDPGKAAPPNIASREAFSYFIRSTDFKELCTSLMDAKIDLQTFAIAMRSEWIMTVGIVDVKDAIPVELYQQTVGQMINHNSDNNAQQRITYHK